MRGRAIAFYCLLFITFIVGCYSPNDNQLKAVLDRSGENRNELEQVLAHYKDDPQKLKAARFLFENMSGHTHYDTLYVKKLQFIYDEYSNILQKHKGESTAQWGDEIGTYWDKEKDQILFANHFQKQDTHAIKADWLIKEIDLAFKAWQENGYTKNSSFDEFCWYILPYRIQNKICLDDSRSMFYQRHAGYFSDSTKDFRVVTDSLHYLYRELKHHNFVASSLPLLTAATFEQIKRGSCDDRAWFNTLLMSSLGMAIATDFVPNWGNRSGGHSWNALLIKGEVYPFEPFWDDDRWKYKKTYNNETVDGVWGKFRLPKIYRHTYEAHLEGPVADTGQNDIPPLFKNPWMKDVSDQYFRTTDVVVDLTEEIPQGINYCYLCVFDHRKWIPVQWGKVEKNSKVTFPKMGRDIIYLPAYYQHDSIIPAAQPFLLRQDGTCEKFACKDTEMTIVSRIVKPYLDKDQIAAEKRWLSGSSLIGYNHPSEQGELLYTWGNSFDMWNNDVAIVTKRPYRYIRLISPSDSIALCELSFFKALGKQLTRIHPVKVSGAPVGLHSFEQLAMVSDHLSATGFRGIYPNDTCRQKGITFDLGTPSLINSIYYVPYTESKMNKEFDFELFYWNNKWISVGTVVGTDRFITFKEVPAGTIYRIKKRYIAEQIFTYKGGIVEWY